MDAMMQTLAESLHTKFGEEMRRKDSGRLSLVQVPLPADEKSKQQDQRI